MIQLYNTLSKQKERLSFSKTKPIGIYVCGMTVYDHCHLGHARVWIVFDLLVRYLNQLGYPVNYVRNITDVDDKIIRRASDHQESTTALTSRMIQSMHADMEALQLLPPTHEPKATDHILSMIELIQSLLDKGYAYLTESGNIYYSVNQFKSYGQLAQQDLNKLLQGARVAVDPEKQHPLDFGLWKKTTSDSILAWNSPWGFGRPGWHLECSTMAIKHLGPSFDIHGGGADLQFPHHQNEVAQSEASTGQPFAKLWMHVGFVQIHQEKMSKSLGNALTVKTLLKEYPGEVIRYFLLTSHYRSPLVYQTEHLQTASTALKRLYKASQLSIHPTHTPAPSSIAAYEEKFHRALQDDLNTPEALSLLFEIAREANRTPLKEEAVHFAQLLKRLGGCLGLLQQNHFPRFAHQEENNTNWITDAIQARQIARKEKQWEKADDIRDTLLQKGIKLEDTSEGTTWDYL